MAYSTIVKPSDYFGTLLYTGNNTNDRDITGLNFTPDFTWIKPRDYSGNHGLFDAVRGADKSIRSNQTRVEDTSPANKDLDSFISGGIRVDQSNYIDTNSDGISTVAWNWKANGAGSSNTDGSISATVSANTTAGFSIVKWTGNGSAGATIGHGLGITPKVVIIKRLSGSVQSWICKFPTATDGYLALNSTDAISASSGWLPVSSSLITLANSWTAYNNSGNDYIAYCFADKKGYSKFGSYIGNGNADGPFIYTGFKPGFVLQKRSDSTSNWHIFDNKREPENVMDKFITPNDSATEGTTTGFDFLSNGFKSRTSDHWNNQSGGTYIYMAFAEQPLVANSGSNGVPATAR
jgi:hypothetical protein